MCPKFDRNAIDSSYSQCPTTLRGPSEQINTGNQSKDSQERINSTPPQTSVPDDCEAIESAESPLQILNSTRRQFTRHSAVASSNITPQTKPFFSPPQASLDLGDSLDPICLGLVTEEEAESLFSL